MKRSTLNNKIKYDVAIIGAGIAGLSAAKTLIENGQPNLILLEAQNYIGGRIRSEFYDGAFIEHGAQWIHGNNSKMKEFAEKHNLTTNIGSTEGQGLYLRNDGYQYPPNFWKRVDDVISNILRACEEFAEEDVKHNFSVGEYLHAEFNNYVNNNVQSDEEKSMWFEIYEWHLRWQEIDNSCSSMNVLSADAWGLYDFDGGEEQDHINLANGYSSLIDAIASFIPSDKIRLNRPVKKIIWKNKNKDYIRIKFSKTKSIKVRRVICTISIGCLKKHLNVMFKPSLPRKMIDSINSTGFDTMGKIFVQFNENWWGDLKGFQFTWNKNLNNTFAGQNGWLRWLSGFDVVTIGPPNTLIGWLNSKGVQLANELSMETLKNDITQLLKQSTKREFLPKIKFIKRSQWDRNEFVRGCYSHITRSCDKLQVGPHTLREPIKNDLGLNVLFLAGEACHPKFFSTTHGAYDSGHEQALELLKSLNQSSQTCTKSVNGHLLK